MGNAFTNFLGGVAKGVFAPGPQLRDYQHASRLYVSNTYDRSPKLGFLYFIEFEIDPDLILDPQFAKSKDFKSIGILAKKVEMPKFKIATETLNQYNRKTVVQTRLNYQEVSIDFHDDMTEITNSLWKNYYRYYYADSNYGGDIPGNFPPKPLKAFGDVKYSDISYPYGLNNIQREPFLKSISIYVLYKQKFTQITLINPLITDWSHDTLDQDQPNKTLQSRMSIAYEGVIYNRGTLAQSTDVKNKFTAQYYDKTPSPLSVGGNGTNTILGPGGVLAGAQSVFGNLQSGNFLAAAIQANTTIRNARSINKAGLLTEASSIANSALKNISQTGNQPGGIGEAIQTSANQSGLGNLGNIGIALFKAPASPETRATPKE